MIKFLTNLIRKERKPSKRGFTLLELIVVIVVLGILAAIAIPTFAGVITRANDASAATTLQAVITDAKSLYAINQGSTPADWYTSFATAASEVPVAAGVIASAPAFTVNVDVPSGDATAASTYVSDITAKGISGVTTGASLSRTQLSIGDDVGNHVFGLANLSSSGNCVFATLDTAPGGVSQAWSMGTGIGSNCTASVAVLGKAADLANVSTLKSSGGSGGGGGGGSDNSCSAGTGSYTLGGSGTPFTLNASNLAFSTTGNILQKTPNAGFYSDTTNGLRTVSSSNVGQTFTISPCLPAGLVFNGNNNGDASITATPGSTVAASPNTTYVITETSPSGTYVQTAQIEVDDVTMSNLQATALPSGDVSVTWSQPSSSSATPTVYYCLGGPATGTCDQYGQGGQWLANPQASWTGEYGYQSVFLFSPNGIGYSTSEVPEGSQVSFAVVQQPSGIGGTAPEVSSVVSVTTSDTAIVDATSAPVISVSPASGAPDATFIDISLLTPTPGAAGYILSWSYAGSCDPSQAYVEGCTQEQSQIFVPAQTFLDWTSSNGGIPIYLEVVQRYTLADATYNITATPVMPDGNAGTESAPVAYTSPYIA